MNRLIILLFLILSFACQRPQQYDLLIKDGIIYTGSGKEPIKGGFVGINGDKIVAFGISNNVTGKQVIDAKGMAVAPGFINMLSWANVALLEDGRSQGDIRERTRF